MNDLLAKNIFTCNLADFQANKTTMQSLYILIPLAAVFVAIAIGLLVWSVDAKQFEDLEREASRILEDD